MSLIIVEGVDCSGKSTLVETLNSTKTLNSGPLLQSPVYEYEYRLLNEYDISDPNQILICDRWHLGELVYGPYLRKKSKINSAIFTHIELFLESQGALKILMTPGIKEISKRILKRNEYLIEHPVIPFINAWYEDFDDKNDSWFNISETRITESLVEDINLASYVKSEDAFFLKEYQKEYIGGPDIDVLVVIEDYRLNTPIPFVPTNDSLATRTLGRLGEENVPLRYGFVSTTIGERIDCLIQKLSHRKNIGVISVGKTSYNLVNNNYTGMHEYFPVFSNEKLLVRKINGYINQS